MRLNPPSGNMYTWAFTSRAPWLDLLKNIVAVFSRRAKDMFRVSEHVVGECIKTDDKKSEVK